MRTTRAYREKAAMDKFYKDHGDDPASDILLIYCQDAIEYLNSLAGTEFYPLRVSSVLQLTKIFIRGYSLEDVMAVIEFKVQEWKNVESMKKFLRPSALFSFSNFKNYHNELKNNINQKK